MYVGYTVYSIVILLLLGALYYALAHHNATKIDTYLSLIVISFVISSVVSFVQVGRDWYPLLYGDIIAAAFWLVLICGCHARANVIRKLEKDGNSVN